MKTLRNEILEKLAELEWEELHNKKRPMWETLKKICIAQLKSCDLLGI